MLYSIGLKLYLAWRLPRRLRLSVPVVCVGNISCGGTGKTPAVISIARHLTRQNIRVAILSRGHGGRFDGDYAVVSDNTQLLLTPDQSGDEPYLISQSLPGVPMIVGRDRRVTGQVAIDRFKPQILLLDDGFQYYQLQRDLDIVLLNGADPFEGGWLLPAGNLREPVGHVRRADALVLTGVEGQTMCSNSLGRFGLPQFSAVRKATQLQSSSGDTHDVQWLKNLAVGCFSGLGHPEQFEQSLVQSGADVRKSWRLDDHAAITQAQLQQFWQQAQQAGCQALICTQKDMVKLPSGCEQIPLYALQIEMVFDEAFWSWFDLRLQGITRGSSDDGSV